MPDNVAGSWTVGFTKGALWPASGSVLSVSIEESRDAGASWQFSAGLTLGGGDWKDRAGNVITTGSWVTTPMYRGTGCRIRLTIDVAQACDIGATMSA
jgi:hypothetical protein